MPSGHDTAYRDYVQERKVLTDDVIRVAVAMNAFNPGLDPRQAPVKPWPRGSADETQRRYLAGDHVVHSELDGAPVAKPVHLRRA
jgi:hypothetical protein